MGNTEQMLRNQLGRIRQENIEMSYEIEKLKVQKKKLQDELYNSKNKVKSAQESRDKYKQRYKQLKESIQSAVSDAIRNVIKGDDNERIR